MDETASEPKKPKIYLLVDGHGLAFRGFYALPGMNAHDGTPTNAVLGFFNMLLKAVDEWRPDGIGLFFDPKGPTARDAMYKEYKEGRRPTPEEFKAQMPIILELAEILGYPVFVRDGTEADDMIASTALALGKEGHEALIFSADKDMFQILRDCIKMARPSKGVSEFKLYDEKVFREEYGFEPAAMADYLALVGDSVDNIPGVKGIGDKTARALVSAYGSLDAIYEASGSVSESVRKKLECGRDAAYMSHSLVLPLPVEAVDSASMAMRPPRKAEASAILGRLGMKKLMERFNLSADNSPEVSAPRLPRESAAAQQTEESELREILSRDRLVLTHNPDRLTARDGNWTLLRASDAGQFEEWLKRQESELILSDYGEYCARFDFLAFLARYRDKIRDTVLADYFYHPDAGLHPALDDAGEIWNAWEAFSGGRFGDDMLGVMRQIDAPLVPVLSALRERGLYADIPALRRLDAELASKIARIETEIYEVSGGVINLNSPKQVGQLLFERLGLPAAKKTKTGYSTDVSVLEELSRLPEPMCAIPLKLLEYRECSKMSSGFVQPFMKHASSSRDGRIHSTFLHTATGTARLASRDPNVQNLPVFGEWAEKFRSAIMPKDADNIFVAADYSQIELRVLAHLSGEERLTDAFRNGRDIHLETASWVFGLEPEKITPEQRRFAKTVNFGLIYGMGAHGLASRMGIPRHQAAAIVDRYFEALPKVKIYLEQSAKDAKAAGYTRSIFGRIRPLAEVTTVEGRGAGSMDRVAVNTPIQSTAADIAKIAMIRLYAILTEKFPDTKLVLQVHDSLICETPSECADEMERVLVDVMEGVNYIDVPLKADPKRGRSLAEV
ncbi:MAG: DNA polymerase I [Synergistaceae bacterium]|jgi:DNA polymerase-1|nr:DNA polymerase I [Synergistaceae bacterium]